MTLFIIDLWRQPHKTASHTSAGLFTLYKLKTITSVKYKIKYSIADKLEFCQVVFLYCLDYLINYCIYTVYLFVSLIVSWVTTLLSLNCKCMTIVFQRWSATYEWKMKLSSTTIIRGRPSLCISSETRISFSQRKCYMNLSPTLPTLPSILHTLHIILVTRIN